MSTLVKGFSVCCFMQECIVICVLWTNSVECLCVKYLFRKSRSSFVIQSCIPRCKQLMASDYVSVFCVFCAGWWPLLSQGVSFELESF